MTRSLRGMMRGQIARREGGPRRFLALAASSAAVAIGFGAFGAHGAATAQAAAWLETGASYQLAHAVAALALTARAEAPSGRGPAALLLAGSWLFAGTLYAMALGAPRMLGAVTPIGGAMMIGGWLWFASRALRR